MCRLGVLVAVLLYGAACSPREQDRHSTRTMLDSTFSVDLRNVSVDSALGVIGRVPGVTINYENSHARTFTAPVSLRAPHISVRDALRRVLQHTDMRPSLFRDVIVVTSDRKPTA